MGVEQQDSSHIGLLGSPIIGWTWDVLQRTWDYDGRLGREWSDGGMGCPTVGHGIKSGLRGKKVGIEGEEERRTTLFKFLPQLWLCSCEEWSVVLSEGAVQDGMCYYSSQRALVPDSGRGY